MLSWSLLLYKACIASSALQSKGSCNPRLQVDRITKKPRVWVYHDKASGEPTGECTITYNDRESQQLALQTYDGEKLRGMELRDDG